MKALADKRKQGKKLTKEKRDLCRIITPKFRLSYPHLHEPHAMQGSTKKQYSIVMLFDKEKKMVGKAPPDKEGVAVARTIQEAIRNAKIAEWGPDKSEWPDDIESPIRDGDDPKFEDKEGYAGHWAIKAISNEDQRPTVVDHDMEPIEKAADIYPGCYARAFIYAYVWYFGGKKGVGFILDHVQKMGEGKSFGGKKPVGAVFAPVELESDSDSDSSDDDDELPVKKKKRQAADDDDEMRF